MRYVIVFDHGNPYYIDKKTYQKYWLSDREPYDPLNPRPCARCGIKVTFGEPDPCIGTIPLACGACCGHGVEDPMAFNGSILTKAQGMYTWYKFTGNQDGGFGRGLHIGDVTEYSALFRLYDNVFISRNPMSVGPMDVYSNGKLSEKYTSTRLSRVISNLETEINHTLQYSSPNVLTVRLPSRDDMLAAYEAAHQNDGYFWPCWTSTFLHGIPLCANQMSFNYAAHMEELNVYPIFVAKDLSVMEEVNQFVLKYQIHDDTIIRDE